VAADFVVLLTTLGAALGLRDPGRIVLEISVERPVLAAGHAIRHEPVESRRGGVSICDSVDLVANPGDLRAPERRI
jgi:hypothetical protein